MRIRFPVLASLAVCAGLIGWSLRAQQPPRGKPPGGPKGQAGQTEQKPQTPPVSDARLLQLQVEFVKKAEKLAADYEKGKDTEKARAVYEEILKLVPQYAKAQQKLDKIREGEASAERKVLEVYANRQWQETGVRVIPGKPIQITASGTWTVNISHTLGPNGIEIPKELRDFNLGALVGVVDNGSGKQEDFQPFLIGPSYDFVADMPGNLLLGMWDSDHSDNAGKLSVEIRGTFDKEK